MTGIAFKIVRTTKPHRNIFLRWVLSLMIIYYLSDDDSFVWDEFNEFVEGLVGRGIINDIGRAKSAANLMNPPSNSPPDQL